MKIRQYDYVTIHSDCAESEAVKLAVVNLRRDLIRTLNCNVNIRAAVPQHQIFVGTAGVSAEISGKADLSLLADENGTLRKEAYLIQIRDGELLIAGSDRRGTIYGIYEFCEMLGVSPWYFFADVPVRTREEIELEEGFQKSDYPCVEYRGIFINDEEELEHWVWRYMGEETIGVRTYEKIFELLLRLKLNYIWPAMHVNSFNLKQENGALADRMGIVVGTSHCDMLMRSNNREWKPWLAKKGYQNVEYDYSLPGRNREILEEYWRESVEQNKDFEVSYTLGMRGIHDSGFETRTLAGKTGKELLQAKIDLLTSVITAQERMLGETLEQEPVKIFVPYKEVLELYDNGLQVPEDLTLIWVNDNYGYVRRYPGEKERKRKGGNGIYYHNSYWAPPGASYLFLNSIPLSHTRNELKKAWQEGIRKIWVTNFGAIKPLEEQLTFYAALAWETGKEHPLTDNETGFLKQWINRTFSNQMGEELAPLLVRFDQITNVRKVEQMDCDAFSQTAYGDEAAERMHFYEQIFRKGNELYDALPKEEKDAFFQLVLMRIHATYFTNGMYYYADRSNLCMKQGKHSDAARYTKKSLAFDHARQRMLDYYNHVMADGKWDGILTPEDFPPPRTAMYPACMPPLSIGEKKLAVTAWNEAEKLQFVKPSPKWMEIANAGHGLLSWKLELPDWLCASKTEGTVAKECRVLIWPDAEMVRKASGCLEGVLTVTAAETGERRQVPVILPILPDAWEKTPKADPRYLDTLEDDGKITLEADYADEWIGRSECRAETNADTDQDAEGCPKAEQRQQQTEKWQTEEQQGGWKRIPNLGRDHGALMEAEKAGAVLTYSFTLTKPCAPLLELHRFPTLNSVGQIRIGVSADDGEEMVLASESNDEHRGAWTYNIRNNVDKLTMPLPALAAGTHTLKLTAIDRYFSFSRIVLYTEERKENSLGMTSQDGRLPEEFDAEAFAGSWYGDRKLLPRPALYLPSVPVGDSLTAEDIQIRQTMWGRTAAPQEILAKAAAPAVMLADGSIRIEAAEALAETKYAFTENGPWQYCASPSHGETGLAMYIRQMRPVIGDPKAAPSLHYRLQTSEGTWTIWLLMQMWGIDTSQFALGIDGTVIPNKELYGGKPIWRYSMEQVWKWVPVQTQTFTEGEHELVLYSQSAHLRFDRIYLTRGEELPPLDCDWE